MRIRTTYSNISLIALFAAVSLLWGCGGGSDRKTPKATYTVTVTNLTGNQPFSPLAVVVHGPGYEGWTLGAPASDGLERLAEGGDPQSFLDQAEADVSVTAVVSGSGIIAPGGSETVTITVNHASDQLVTVATMLVNTNDGFTGVSGVNGGGLASGQSRRVHVLVYDAGTEANTETASSIPGPAGGGEGYNAARETGDFVTIHRGAVTADDGLAASALDESHRFMTPDAAVVITRTN